MPEVLQLGSAIAGILLVIYGGVALITHWADGNQAALCLLFVKAIDRTESLVGGYFVPISFIFILFVGTLSWGYARVSSLIVTMSFEYPSQVDIVDGDFSITLLISNESERSVTLNDFRLAEISSEVKIYSPYDGLSLCHDPQVLSAAHLNDDMAFSSQQPPTLGFDAFNLTLARSMLHITIDGNKSGMDTFSLAAHTGAEIGISFSHISHDYSKWNALSICPSFKIFGNEVGVRRTTCPGATRIVFPLSEYDDRVGQLNSLKYAGMWMKSPVLW